MARCHIVHVVESQRDSSLLSLEKWLHHVSLEGTYLHNLSIYDTVFFFYSPCHLLSHYTTLLISDVVSASLSAEYASFHRPMVLPVFETM